MLKPELYTFELDSLLLNKLKRWIADTLWAEAKRLGVTKLSISRAKELLITAQPCLAEHLPVDSLAFASVPLLDHRKISLMLHDALAESALFFRTEGARVFREVQKTANADDRATLLWKALFDRRLLRWLRERGYLDDTDQAEAVDILVESIRVWIKDLAQRLTPKDDSISPAAFFLDTESELSAKISIDGNVLTLRGRPDALIIDPTAQTPEIVEYKLGLQGQVELQIAQTVLYALVCDAAKGTQIERAKLQFFRLVGDTPPDAPKEPVSDSSSNEPPKSEFSAEIEQAFDGYIGNRPAVRRLKIECAYALQSIPVQMPINLMLCGPGGLGKTELARRVARALKLPLVDVPANTIKSVDTLLQRIDATLQTHSLDSMEAGTDSGLAKRCYPPLVVFLDEIHLLKHPDQYLNCFEPKERRAVGSREVGDLSAVTFIGATTDKGILPAPFRSRFTCVDLEPYTAEDVAQIVAPNMPNVDKAFLIALANMSRRNPRIALTRAGEVQRQHSVHPEAYPMNMAGLQRIAEEQWMVDALGMTNADRDYLRALSAGPRGLSAMAQRVPVGVEEIRTVIEPFLMELGCINITNKGRELTELGRKKLKELSLIGRA